MSDPFQEPAQIVDVSIVRDATVALTFDDDLVATFAVSDLRANCPCATCRGWRERGEVAWPRPGQSNEIAIRSADFAGAWGLSIAWTDGHDTGIYSWAALRRWWLAGMGSPLTDEASGEA